MSKSRRNRGTRQNTQPATLIYHPMAIEENFERCAYRLFEMTKGAQQARPGAARILYLDIDGHRDELGDFDRDASEIINYFLPELLSYLTEYVTPLYRVKNKRKQRNDIPQALAISDPPGEDLSYDIASLMPRRREQEPELRSSPHSVKTIASYIGISLPRCLICRRTPVERAHAVPKSLGGSYDIRNFALLCPDHHKQAPDISDAEAFWAWIDYMVMRNSGGDYSDNHPRMLGIRVPEIAGSADQQTGFANELQRELIELYGWGDEDFSSVTWAVNIELHKVLEKATAFHFGVIRKPSTYAWAYDVALRRTGRKRPPYFPIY